VKIDNVFHFLCKILGNQIKNREIINNLSIVSLLSGGKAQLAAQPPAVSFYRMISTNQTNRDNIYGAKNLF